MPHWYYYLHACLGGLTFLFMIWSAYDFLVYRRLRSLVFLMSLFLFYAALTKMAP